MFESYLFFYILLNLSQNLDCFFLVVEVSLSEDFLQVFNGKLLAKFIKDDFYMLPLFFKSIIESTAVKLMLEDSLQFET